MSRASMQFRTVQYGPYTIRLMEGDEPGYGENGPLLVSIAGPGLPNVRLTENGAEAGPDEYGPDHYGLILFGTFKGDRPALGDSHAD